MTTTVCKCKKNPFLRLYDLRRSNLHLDSLLFFTQQLLAQAEAAEEEVKRLKREVSGTWHYIL